MTRPKPRVILQHNEDYNVYEVIQTTNVAHLTFCGEPVGYRVTNTLTGKHAYPKTASINPAFILLLAAKLNSIHKTTDFAVGYIKRNSNE